jgi:hypothetical protein
MSTSAAADVKIPEVKTAAELAEQPEEYRTAVQKIVVSHAVNELYGAQVFDERRSSWRPRPMPMAHAAWRGGVSPPCALLHC